MSYEQQWQGLENQLKSIQKIEPFNGYIRDGIANLSQWQQQEIRPLFIGKEAYGASEGSDGGYSITEHCMNQKPVAFCKESPRSWQKTAHIGYALQHGFASYNAAIRHKDEVYEALRTIAFINVGKLGGGKRTPPQHLTKLYNQNRALLHEQIALCQPNVIIGWNTLGLFMSDLAFEKRFGVEHTPRQKGEHISYWQADGRLLINAKHPSYFKIKPADYVNGIVNTVRENAGSLNIDKPVW